MHALTARAQGMHTQTELLETALPAGPALDPSWRDWLPVRTLGPQHRSRITTHLQSLREQDRNLRFGHNASDEQIGHYANRLDFERDEIFGVFDSQLVLVAMSHLAFDGAQGLAEFGVSVLPQMRGKGVGGRLFGHAVTHARNRGALVMAIHIARENTAMLSIVRRAGAQIEFDGPDAIQRQRLVTGAAGPAGAHGGVARASAGGKPGRQLGLPHQDAGVAAGRFAAGPLVATYAQLNISRARHRLATIWPPMNDA